MAIYRPEIKPPIIREEIAISAEQVPDLRAKKERLIDLLKELNPERSRAVVFVTSRSLAEDLADLVQEQTGLAAAPFHAGLSAKARAATYEYFREGVISVLCATKAFGMGMDIDNIHLVIHFGPPSSLEDYIQEIGRAARNPAKLEEAGLDRARAHLVYEPSDFDRMRDRLQRSLLSVVELKEIHSLIVQEWERVGKSNDAPITVEFERFATRLRGGEGTQTQIRVGLFWLERLGRVRVGYYAPACVEIEFVAKHSNSRAVKRALDPHAQRLWEYLSRQADRQAEGEGKQLAVEIRHAQRSLDLTTRNEFFARLAELARLGLVQFRRTLLLPLADRRARESREGAESEKWPILDAALQAVKEIGAELEESGERIYTPTELEELLAKVANNHIKPDAFTWLSETERQETVERERKNFPRYWRAILRLLRGLHIIYVEELIDEGLRLRLTAHRRDWDLWLRALPILIRKVMAQIVSQQEGSLTGNRRPDEVDGQALLLAARQVGSARGTDQQAGEISISVSHVEVIIRFLRALGYLARVDRFVPMTLEVEVRDPSPITLGEGGRDAKVLKEFQEQKRLRLLRLAALEAIPELTHDRDRFQEFVDHRYFNAASPQELMALLEEYLPVNGSAIRRLREDALRELVEGNEAEGKPGLSDQQMAVYNAPLDHHIMVIAGPGAGKTHTLLARLVRLVHAEHVEPSEILVLAFTRAVVSELRYRLQDLLQGLGYATLAGRIRVTTFHSFVLKTLHDFRLIEDDFRLEGAEVDCFELFERKHKEVPALRNHIAGRYRYVFVDEFQDVRDVRYRLLHYLAAGGQTYLLVAGDDDQSIYDYENQYTTRCRTATDYFHDFQARYRPLRFSLTCNYRSARKIVQLSEEVIARLPGRLKKGENLESHRSDHGWVAWKDGNVDLVDVIAEVWTQLERLGESSEKRSPHNTIAVLARTNADVYKVKAYLQQRLGNSLTLLVQGEESRFIDRRDVACLIDHLRRKLGNKDLTPPQYLLEALRECLTHSTYRKWLGDQGAEEHELLYLAEEFLEGSPPDDVLDGFIEYIREMSRNGNYLRVVARRQAVHNTTGRVLLSTIHKVKGIEFPAVILLDSEMKVDDVEQELRVMYVGMTRAEDVLVVLKGEREERLLRLESFEPSEDQRLELAVTPSLGDLFVSLPGRCPTIGKRIRNRVRAGDPVKIVHKNDGKFEIRHLPSGGKKIGELARPDRRKQNLAWRFISRFPDARAIEGLEVTGVYRRYAELDKRQKRRDGTTWFDDLHPETNWIFDNA